MKIIDTHAHLDHIEDLDHALSNADQAGVDGIVTVSIEAASCRKNLEIKRSTKRPTIYLAMGMHPSDVDRAKIDECVQLIRAHQNELAAIGEIGLDFWYPWVRKDKEKKDEQRAVFRVLLELARETDLPVIVHTRGTWRESFETVKEVGLTKAEFHWYSGPVDVLKDILDSGYYVSASPSLAYSPQSREAIRYAPIDRTMIETDSPVFYHVPAAEGAQGEEDGFKAEPKDVFRTLKAYCVLKNLEEESALVIFNRNAREFFCLVG
jgi:TatD DNase family protein